jgi:DNA mismatch endonuclease (patch repair protein)
MADTLEPSRRSSLMSRVTGKDTKPEMVVRRIAHALGLRFRLHKRDLPGRPDLVFPKHRLAVFVHGCFWHRHEGCRLASTPKTRAEFWQAKFDTNVARDVSAVEQLAASGWKVLVLWECETRDAVRTEAALRQAIHR